MKANFKQIGRILTMLFLVAGFCLTTQASNLKNTILKKANISVVKGIAPTSTPGPIADDSPIDPKTGKKQDSTKPSSKKR
jgi:hypothetical protein